MSNNSNKKNTFFQQLNNFFNIDGFGSLENITKPPTENKVIIRGNTPEEVYIKGLELEQKKALENKFLKSTDRGFHKALQYEAGRLQAYIDYEGMEYYPIISSALDLYMEEATTIGNDGKMLNIYSNKERIKFLLEELFYNIININVNLPFWTRSMIKYGDNFIHIYGEKKKGIISVKQLINYEIERIEKVVNGKPKISFKQRFTGDEFNVFEIGHFRLLGDDKMIPYGSSQLNKIRRVWRMLIMGEDSMLSYRILRAAERRVFKIDVGNIDEDDIESYMYKVATKFKKTPEINPNNGQFDHRFNILGNDEDYFLPVRNAGNNTGIETLPGASNMNEINDIEYLRDLLLMGLGIPKPFLSFQDAAGGGKNLAQFDIRFAKKINRIQQSLIQELNKIAILHLSYLGYSGDDLSDFTLTLTNPSTQQELLKSELLREKAQTYTQLTTTEAGIAPMSHTNAKRFIMNMSDKEIINDLKQQKMERTIIQELVDSPLIIKKTGLFNDIDNKYGEPLEGLPLNNSTSSGNTQQNTSKATDNFGGNIPQNNTNPNINLENDNELPPISEKVINANYINHINELVYGDSSDPNVNTSNKIRNVISENIESMKQSNSIAIKMVDEIDIMLNESNLITNDEYDLNDININDVIN